MKHVLLLCIIFFNTVLFSWERSQDPPEIQQKLKDAYRCYQEGDPDEGRRILESFSPSSPLDASKLLDPDEDLNEMYGVDRSMLEQLRANYLYHSGRL